MQYLVSVIFDDKTGSATPAEMAAINAFNDRLEAKGRWVFAGGLNSPCECRRLPTPLGLGAR